MTTPTDRDTQPAEAGLFEDLAGPSQAQVQQAQAKAAGMQSRGAPRLLASASHHSGVIALDSIRLFWRLSIGECPASRARAREVYFGHARRLGREHDRYARRTRYALRELHDLLARLQGELKFQKTRNEALNFEIARLKR